jgi:23S rRNA pseudouridine1911/1915/1917 synthase
VEGIKYLYNSGAVFAVYKPAGVHSVQLPDGRGGDSVAALLVENRPQLASAGKSPEDAGLVHRLDFSTSGVLLGASTREAWQALFDQVSQGGVLKEYLACVEGRLESEQEISSFIGSPNRGAKKMRSYPKDPGLKARALFGTTLFKPISYDSARNISLVAAVASPARRHQIRLHASTLGHPLVGDSLYGSTTSLGGLAPTPRDFFLHSWLVEFAHPETGVAVTVKSPFAGELSWTGPITLS